MGAVGWSQARGFKDVQLELLRKLRQEDYLAALKMVRPSLSVQTVEDMKRWGEQATQRLVTCRVSTITLFPLRLHKACCEWGSEMGSHRGGR